MPRGLGHLEDDGHLRVEPLLPGCRKVGPGVEDEPVDGSLQARRCQGAAPAVVVGDALADRLPTRLSPAVQRESYVRCRASTVASSTWVDRVIRPATSPVAVPGQERCSTRLSRS